MGQEDAYNACESLRATAHERLDPLVPCHIFRASAAHSSKPGGGVRRFFTQREEEGVTVTDAGDVIVADRSTTRSREPDETHARCRRCRAHVWVGPVQRAARERGRKILCSVCIRLLGDRT